MHWEKIPNSSEFIMDMMESNKKNASTLMKVSGLRNDVTNVYQSLNPQSGNNPNHLMKSSYYCNITVYIWSVYVISKWRLFWFGLGRQSKKPRTLHCVAFYFSVLWLSTT